MAFGKNETYNDNLISYTENIDMLLNDLKLMGYKDLTKEKLNNILQNGFSIGRAIRMEVSWILDKLGNSIN